MAEFPPFISRRLSAKVQESFREFPAVLIVGARQEVASLTALFLEAVQEVRRNMEAIQAAAAAAQARAAVQMPNPFAIMTRYSGGGSKEAPPSARERALAVNVLPPV